MIVSLLVLAGMLVIAPAAAPRSLDYVLTDHSFNVGAQAEMSSPTYRVTSVSAGADAAEDGLSSDSYSASCSYSAAYPPPGEVHGLNFSSLNTLVWEPDPSGGDYNLYRDVLSLVQSGYGNCLKQELSATTSTDSASPAVGDAFFYLVTAENRLDEEGTKGHDSSGVERPNPDSCP